MLKEKEIRDKRKWSIPANVIIGCKHRGDTQVP
jgi:hypothetical protein